MGTSSCFHVTQVEEIKRIIGEAMYENEVVGPDGSPVSGDLANGGAIYKPWRVATFGDSRANTLSTQPDVALSQSVREHTVSATHMCGIMGDAVITRNYGVSGALTSDWASASRTAGKTIYDLSKSDVDFVHIQYGANDATTLVGAATIVANLKGLVLEVLKSNKKVLFESIQPVAVGASNYAAAQVTIDAVNADMRAWLQNFGNRVAYADSATAIKGGGAYGDNALYMQVDGTYVHLNRNGAKIAGRVCAEAVRTILPRRFGLYPAMDNRFAGFVTHGAYTFLNFEVGTASDTSITYGEDAEGVYIDVVWTPATLSSGECRARIDIAANFLTSAVPYYALNGAEILSASARVVCDSGSGGAPNAYMVSARHRFYTAAIFRDWGTIPPGAPTSDTPDFIEAFDETLILPSVANTAASVSATPAAGAGWVFQVFVASGVVGVPVRVRIYNAQLRPAGYKTTPVSGALPASGVAYTNTTPSRQLVTIGGGTVSQIAINAVSTALTSGAFVLEPGDTLTPTYSAAPTMLVKYLWPT